MEAIPHLMIRAQSPHRTQVPMALWLRIAFPAVNQVIGLRLANPLHPPHHLLDPRSALSGRQ